MFFWIKCWTLVFACGNLLNMVENAPIEQVHEMLADPLAVIGAQRIEIAQQAVTIGSLQQTVNNLTFELLMYKRRLFGRSAEASEQLMFQDLLFPAETIEIELPASTPALTKVQSQPKPTLPRMGRMILPADLPRREETLLPPGVLNAEGQVREEYVQIGAERTERLACTPPSFWVDVIVRPKFAMTAAARIDPEIPPPIADGSKEGVTIAELPRFVVDSGLLHESLIAHVVVSKIDDHLPLHRQSEMLQRDCGVRLSVSTLSDTVLRCAEALEPVATVLFTSLLKRDALHVDETGCPTLAKGKTKKSKIWTYVSTSGPGAHGNDVAPIIFYRYTDDKSGTHLPGLLESYSGYLHADASNVYDQLFRKYPLIREVACWAHGRRKFYDIAVASPVPVIAHQAVHKINVLFELEAHCTKSEFTPQQRLVHRQQFAKPLVEEFNAWAIKQRAALSASSPTAKAFCYMLNHWGAFTRYLERGDLKIDNNAAERALRVIAVGRNNWQFAGSARGGRAIATLMSLIETAKANGLNPRDWLVNALKRLPSLPSGRIHELLPLRPIG